MMTKRDLDLAGLAQPTFYVREIPIYGDLILSPMDGYSDLPFRLLCRELGSAMSYTEFVNVDSLYAREPNEIIRRKLKFDPAEYPITFQIYGHDEDRLVETALRLQDWGPTIIDLNMGCYVRKVAERGAGSGMLRDPAKIGRVFARLTRALRVPVTGKIRLGWDEQTRNHREVARVLEDNGASLIAVHARTKQQGYTGSADWDAIAEVKQAVRIPVIGNGDVKTVADIARIQAQTGCDGVMIGRAAIGNPWIFSRKDRQDVTPEDRLALMRRHVALNVAFYGERLGMILFRKHAVRYIQRLPGGDAMRLPLAHCTSPDEFERIVSSRSGDCPAEFALSQANGLAMTQMR
jgi:nifR3 family TIM-barrel protein